ncbi:hypothetical protein BgiBS90_027682 [Biomphalaria glabrata]|nr:hypothetical protein BgiBS90_027682 [Biomphalaria glabrata]
MASQDQPGDVGDWKEAAKKILKTYYVGFSGTQWHQFVKSTDNDIIRAKICYAMFGPPASEAKSIEEAYTDEQRKTAQGILDVIYEVHQKSSSTELRIGFIFICCKQDKSPFALPLFSVFVGKDTSGRDLRTFVDLQGRTYKDWDDWKSSNCLPELEYCYPTRGFFTCSGDESYKFDAERDPDVEFGKSPASKTSTWLLGKADTVTAITSFASGVVGIAACFTPLAPFVLATAAVTGSVSAGYGAVRGASRLYDKGVHGESLADFESLTLWLGIVATPLHFSSSLVNARLVAGAQQGRIFSNSMRTFATLLNFTTLGVDSAMLAMGLANLINKASKDEVTALDVVQFSMSVFFFSNTLMQPKVASSIISQAQEMHLNSYMDKMSDEATKETFKNFMDRNRGDGGIKDTSKIIRTVNRMEDANKFFKSVNPNDKIDIGGRKGRTVLVSDNKGNVNRINPNRVLLTKQTPGTTATFNFNKDYKKLKKCYGKDPSDVELNGEKIFQNMSEQDQRRVSHVFGGSAKYNLDILNTAHTVAEALGLNTASGLMSVIEIVAAEVQGRDGAELSTILNNIRGPGKQTFLQNLQMDLNKATRLAESHNLSFDSPLTAVYHYRKHGNEFPKLLSKFGNSIDVYLGPVSHNIFQDCNLRERHTLQDGTVRKIYSTNGDHFGVITTTQQGQKISTMFQKPGCTVDYSQKLNDYFRNSPGQIEPISDAANRLARFMGFRAFHVNLVVGGHKTKLDDMSPLDPAVHEEIVHYLNMISN